MWRHESRQALKKQKRTKQKMNIENLNQLAEAVESLMTSTGVSQNDLAKNIGISSSYLTHLKNRNFDNIPAGVGRKTTFSESIANKIAVFLKLDVQMWDIDNYTHIENCLIEAKMYKEHRIIDGAKGSGKTFAIEMFKKSYPSETYVVTADDDMSPKAFLESLASKMDLHIGGSKRVIRMAIEAKIKSQNKPLIIVDEAENLKTGSYGAIKALYDAVKDYAGIVLVGANEYADMLRKKAGRNMTPFTQLYSRFSAETVLLNTMSKADVVMIAKLNDISDKETINTILSTCHDYRELDRKIKRVLRDRTLQEA